LQAISAVDCNSSPFGSSILTENVVDGDGNLRMFGGLDSDTARTSGLAECRYSGGKPRHRVMIRQVASLDGLDMLVEVITCVGGGTNEVSEAC
jgi:hypothetical protein